MRRTPRETAAKAGAGWAVMSARMTSSAVMTYRIQPPIRLISGEVPNGVGKCSLVMPFTKCGVAFAPSTPAKNARIAVCSMSTPWRSFPRTRARVAGETPDRQVDHLAQAGAQNGRFLLLLEDPGQRVDQQGGRVVG